MKKKKLWLWEKKSIEHLNELNKIKTIYAYKNKTINYISNHFKLRKKFGVKAKLILNQGFVI